LPILWRYLLKQYLKVLLFCIAAFIAILLTTRLDDIARFAALGPAGKIVLLYTLYQIPYILPIAIPIAGLISAILLIQRLSRSYELVAFRAAGLSIRQILSPILAAAALLTLLNFALVSEVATRSHLSSRLLKYELGSVNPLLLLQSKQLKQLQGVYFETMGQSKIGEAAQEVVLALPSQKSSRINLLIADRIAAKNRLLVGENISLLSSLSADEREAFDPLVLENLAKTSASTEDFTRMVEKRVWNLNNDHLQLPLLLAKYQEEKKALKNAAGPKQAQIEKSLTRIYSELFRRLSVGLAAFVFTLTGLAFGVSVTRKASSRGTVAVALLAALYMACFFASKSSAGHLLLAALFSFFPLLLMTTLSLWMLSRAARGIA